jgi:tRNA dimethylallyltransferase
MELAARDGRLIVNADALQVYACWRVLTARPSAADEAALPHALYGHVGRDRPIRSATGCARWRGF